MQQVLEDVSVYIVDEVFCPQCESTDVDEELEDNINTFNCINCKETWINKHIY